MEISELYGGDRELAIKFESGALLNVVYEPGRFTGEDMARVAVSGARIMNIGDELRDEDVARQSMDELMAGVLGTFDEIYETGARVIQSWDVTVDGKPVAADVAGMRLLGLENVIAVLGEITTDSTPGKAEADPERPHS